MQGWELHNSNSPVGHHVVKAFVLELEVEAPANVSLGEQHLQAHAAKHSMESGQQKQKLLHKTARKGNRK